MCLEQVVCGATVCVWSWWQVCGTYGATAATAAPHDTSTRTDEAPLSGLYYPPHWAKILQIHHRFSRGSGHTDTTDSYDKHRKEQRTEQMELSVSFGEQCSTGMIICCWLKDAACIQGHWQQTLLHSTDGWSKPWLGCSDFFTILYMFCSPSLLNVNEKANNFTYLWGFSTIPMVLYMIEFSYCQILQISTPLYCNSTIILKRHEKGSLFQWSNS